MAGHFNLIYSPPGSRREGFELLAASERGAHMHLVKQRRLTAMALDPRSTGRGAAGCGWVRLASGCSYCRAGSSPAVHAACLPAPRCLPLRDVAGGRR